MPAKTNKKSKKGTSEVPLSLVYDPENNDEIIVSVDECARGTCFSRVYAAGVVLPKDFKIPANMTIRDSKSVKKQTHSRVAEYIKKHALAWHVAYRDEKRIDDINIGEAIYECWQECLDSIYNQLEKPFNLIIVDGKVFRGYKNSDGEKIEHVCVPKADDTYLATACASILAKSARTAFVHRLAQDYPLLNERYDISNNEGYPNAPKLKKGLQEFGISEFFRKSWGTCKGLPFTTVIEE